jgi:hypothetical protein
MERDEGRGEERERVFVPQKYNITLCHCKQEAFNTLQGLYNATDYKGSHTVCGSPMTDMHPDFRVPSGT